MHRHTKSPLGTFAAVDERFKHVHVDLVGPLPPSKGSCYLLTCVDRFSRWPEAIPIPDCTSETVAQAFLERWIAQYGCPSIVTTDRGSHFESAFHALLDSIGCQHIRTTAYHPASNGLVERLHRQLKAALRTYNNQSWKEVLPLVLLGLRSTVKADLQATPSELMFGHTIRLPGELVAPKPDTTFNQGSYVERLRSHMQQFGPAKSRFQVKPSYIPPKLNESKYVFVRVDAVRNSLQPPYVGPYRVIERTDKFYVLDKGGKNDSVSIDRLKPAFLEEAPVDVPMVAHRKPPEAPPSVVPQPAAPTVSPDPAPNSPVASTSPRPILRTNRMGREVRQPARFADFVNIIYF